MLPSQRYLLVTISQGDYVGVHIYPNTGKGQKECEAMLIAARAKHLSTGWFPDWQKVHNAQEGMYKYRVYEHGGDKWGSAKWYHYRKLESNLLFTAHRFREKNNIARPLYLKVEIKHVLRSEILELL